MLEEKKQGRKIFSIGASAYKVENASRECF